MTVGNPENFNVNLTTNRPEVDQRVPCDLSNLTLKKLCSWIDSQTVSSTIKSELKLSASRFPHQMLKAWKRDYSKHLSKAQKKLISRNISIKEEQPIREIEEKTNFEMRMPQSDTFEEDIVEDTIENIIEDFVENNAIEDINVVVEDVDIVVEDVDNKSEQESSLGNT